MSLAEDAYRLNLRARHRFGLSRHGGHPLPALILLTDEQRLADPCAAVARLPRGAAVILRHYGLPEAARAALARRLRAITRARGLLLLIAATGGGPRDLARIVRADGVHLPEWCVRRQAWPKPGPRKPGSLITAAAHSWPALRRAMGRPIDAVLLSPVFATASHAAVNPLGALRFAVWARQSSTPVYALGGIDNRSAARLRHSRACGFAGIGGLIADGNSSLAVAAVDRRPRRG